MDCTKTFIDCNIKKTTDEFYSQKVHSNGVMSYCKNCFNKRCIQRWIDRKLKAIQYKGSKCRKCNLHIDNTHYSVFEFHHRDPTQKDVSWNKLRLKSWTKIKFELDKCELLCANCHRIVHAESEGFPEQPEFQKEFPT